MTDTSASREIVTRQLVVARHLYFLARSEIKSDLAQSHFAGVNLLHDALEMLLWAAATARNAVKGERVELVQLFDAVNDTLELEKLAFRAALVQLNRLRINSKHYGLQPEVSVLTRLEVQIAELLSQIARLVFDQDFFSISLLSLLPPDRASTSRLRDAEAAMIDGRPQDVLVECRKAFYLEFEASYDVSPWAQPDNLPMFANISCSAPYYAKNPKYIEDNVKDPTDFIVLDHARIRDTLHDHGIDPVLFWNVWRLTPSVYKREGRDQWVIRDETAVRLDKQIAEHAAYVLQKTSEILMQYERARRQQRIAGVHHQFVITTGERVNVYGKASLDARVDRTLPGGTVVMSDFTVSGFGTDLRFWHVGDILKTDGKIDFVNGYLLLADAVEAPPELATHWTVDALRQEGAEGDTASDATAIDNLSD